jgi:hypothetical protein
MIATHFDKPFVKCVDYDVVVMRAWQKEPEKKRFELDTRTHAAEFKVPEPQFSVGQLSIETESV